MDSITQILPQVVGEADFAVVAVALALTVGHIDGLVDCINNLRDKYGPAIVGQTIAATRAPNAVH